MAARFGRGDLAGRMTQRGGWGLSCCLRTVSWRRHFGYGRPGDAGLRNSGNCWSGWNCGRSRSHHYGADPDNPEIYACYPGTPTQKTQIDGDKY